MRSERGEVAPDAEIECVVLLRPEQPNANRRRDTRHGN